MAASKKQIPVRLVPQDGGILLRRSELAAFMRLMGPLAGFEMGADDIVGADQNGNGLFLRRRRPPGPPPEPTYITLTLEVQYRWSHANQCVAGINSEDGVAYLITEQVKHYTGGNVTTTRTASGSILSYGPSGEPGTCPDITTTTSGTPVGSLVSTDPTTYSSAADFSGIFSAAVSALENDGSPSAASSGTWLSDASPVFPYDVGLAYFEADEISVDLYSWQYRWKATGDYSLRVAWDEGGGSHTVDLAPGTPSAWFDDTIPSVKGIVNRSVVSVTAVTVL